jgi:predicted ATPase
MFDCDCYRAHERRRVVLTGGPGAGKTAVLELVRRHFCRHVDVLPESASLLFLGGFRRGKTTEGQAATQRAIFHVQRELETVADAEVSSALTLCDRGTVDGFAYWPYPQNFFAGMGTSRHRELDQYYAVIHLRTPPVEAYNHLNPVRIETAKQAAAIDARIIEAWAGHPRRFFVESSPDFLDKARAAIGLIEGLAPECCRPH